MIMTEEIEDLYPLSPMQQGMLFHSLYAAGSGVYFKQTSCVLEGELKAVAFEQAWQMVVDRHPVLRSSFIWEELDAPVQMVHRRVLIPIAHYDWRTLTAREQSARLQLLLQEDRAVGFDFAQPPLMRLTLVRLSEERHQLLWSHHHLLFDGWSLPLLMKEVFSFYEALARGETLQLTVPRPYRDYISWLQEQDLKRAEEFWRERLSGFTTPTQLSVERRMVAAAAGAEADGHGHNRSERGYGERRVSLSEEVTTQLQSLARQHQLTLNTILQGAWALLLSRYSGSEDVVFGATVSGRPAELSGVEQMLGLFINTLPVRVKLEGRESVLEWLRQLQAEAVETRQFEYTPLVEVQRWSEVERGRALFDSILVFQNYPVNASLRQAASKTGLEIAQVQSDERTNYGLALIVMPGQQLTMRMGYERSRYEDGVVERMLGHLLTLLENMAADPQQRVSDLEMLDEAERQQLLVEWNDTAREYADEWCVKELFEQQAERTPEALALSFAAEQLSYAELNGRANQLAHYLRSIGVGPEVRVAICLQRSVALMVGVLAVLKAGGAYVPLDAHYPLERLAYLLSDCEAAVLLTQESLLAGLPSHWAQEVCLDRDWELITAGSKENLRASALGEHLAYVIYTSGSSGSPKGVMISQAGLAHYLRWALERYQVAAGAGAPVHSALGFDLTVTSLWLPLLAGRTTELLSEEGGVEGLVGALRGQRDYSLVKLTPSHLEGLNQLLAGAEAAGATRRLVVGGEALLGESLSFWREHAPGISIINEYGPTETVVGCCVYEVSGAEGESGAIPIGRPIDNTQLYILDEYQALVAVGVKGELYIGGKGVARGYLKRPGLTAEKFIPDPFSARAGARLYRTGDLARYLADGNIEYLGRTDNQVKVRGYRIELGEIESVLSQHSQVREAVVVVQETTGGGGQQRLVGYVVTEAGAELSTSELRQHLTEKLPEYMIPALFVQLEELPLTPNGKVDRRALPEPDSNRPNLPDRFVPPTNPLEEDLARLFSTLLGVERIGIEDNFLELGGHSLLAMQLISRVRADFDMEIGLQEFFDTPTVKHLGAMMEAAFLATTEAGEIEKMLSELELIEEDTETNETTARHRL